MPSKKTSGARSKASSTKSSGVTAEDSVTRLLDAACHPHREIIDLLRALIASAVPEAVESIKWNAPSFATSEHFATFHLRAKVGVQLVLHQGAKPQSTVGLQALVADTAGLLEWKGLDRAVLVVRDRGHLESIRAPLEGILARWAAALP